jgi:alkanesulfonate monooxygenase SsuD/methylene tetrahydromethanopterin reductase-like flavin-dependent oxidoreductase (luciferase family)
LPAAKPIALVGTPEQIADGMAAMSAVGLDG